MHARPSQLIHAALMARETRPPAEWLLAAAELWAVLFFQNIINQLDALSDGAKFTRRNSHLDSALGSAFCCFCLEKCSAMNNTFICEQTNSGARTHLYGAFLRRVASKLDLQAALLLLLLFAV